MKKFKIFLFLGLSLMAIIIAPSFCRAETISVGSDDALRNAITNSNDGDVLSLTSNIALIRPIEIVDKTLTINGNGFTITRNTENWSENGSNATLLTAGAGAKLTLTNLKLTNSQKYGVQSYNGGYVILDGVTISNCGFGGVLVNAGTVEVRNLVLHKNGQTTNNGIEIAKGYSVNTGDNEPTLIMNGTLSSSEKDNVIFVAINDKLSEFKVENTESSENKVLLNGNEIVVTDANNDVIFTSKLPADIDVVAEDYAENVVVTLHVGDKTVPVSVMPGTVLTKEFLTSKVDLAKLGLTNTTIVGFYSDAEFKTAFDFAKEITANTDVFVKVETNKKDTTPKTGVNDYFELAVMISVVSIISLAVLKRKVG